MVGWFAGVKNADDVGATHAGTQVPQRLVLLRAVPKNELVRFHVEHKD